MHTYGLAERRRGGRRARDVHHAGERHEATAGHEALRLGGDDDGRKDHRVTAAGDDGPVGLFCDPAGLELDFVRPDHD